MRHDFGFVPKNVKAVVRCRVNFDAPLGKNFDTATASPAPTQYASQLFKTDKT
jgi:hypothetical protein